MIWDTDQFLLLTVGITIFIAAIEIGFRLGDRHRISEDPSLPTHINTLRTATLALLALLLGFTFNMSVTRFNDRKALILEEVSAIETVRLRAKILPEKLQLDVVKQLKAYVDTRLEFYENETDSLQRIAANEKENYVKQLLWTDALATFTDARIPTISASLFVQGVNNIFIVNEKWEAALENHVPETVIMLLFLVSNIGMGFVGYEYGLTGKRRHGSTIIFAFLIISVLTVILDFDRPQRGFIAIPQDGMLNLQKLLVIESKSA